jgi:hypothetical protein
MVSEVIVHNDPVEGLFTILNLKESVQAVNPLFLAFSEVTCNSVKNFSQEERQVLPVTGRVSIQFGVHLIFIFVQEIFLEFREVLIRLGLDYRNKIIPLVILIEVDFQCELS